MKHICQKDSNGCGIASVAMVSKKSYDEVRQIYLDIGGDEYSIGDNGTGVSFEMMQKLLKEVKFPQVRLVNTPCIASLKIDNRFHFVVIDENGFKLDPIKGV